MKKFFLIVLFVILASPSGYCRDKKADLQLTIKSSKDLYPAGENIRLDVTLMNNSNKELIVIWGKDSTQLVSDKFTVLSALVPPGIADRYEAIIIKPKTALVKKVSFKNLLDPGVPQHKVTLSYNYPKNIHLDFKTTSRQKIWTGSVISNTLTLSVVKSDEPPLKIKVAVENAQLEPESCEGCGPNNLLKLPFVKIKATVVNNTDDDLELYGLGANDLVAFWNTDVKDNSIMNGVPTKFDFNKPLDKLPTTTLKARGEITVPLELWPRVENGSISAAQKISYHLIFTMVKAEDYPAKTQFELHHLYNDLWDPKSKMKDTVNHVDIVSDPFTIEVLAVDPLSIKPATPPVYQDEWQNCKEASECTAVREGYNWTCVNRAYEQQARVFCKFIDAKGVAGCSIGGTTFDQRPVLPSPVCTQGKCYCEDIKTWSGGPEDECLEDQDCMITKGGNWESINKKYDGKRYQAYYGAACSDAFRYPPPRAFCFNGRCTMGDDKSKMFFKIFE